MIQGSKRVLIVDDDYYFREVLQQSIEECGFDVLTASDVMFAEKTIEVAHPDLVITDIRMPGQSGLDLLRWIRAHFPEIPVVMMTGFTDATNAIAAHREGAVGFLPKPFRLEEIESFLARLNGRDGSISQDRSLEANEFIEIPVSEFISGSRIRSNVYMKLQDGDQSRFIKIAHSAEDLTSEKVHSYQEKGIQAFYVRKEDFQAQGQKPKSTKAGVACFSETLSQLEARLKSLGASTADISKAGRFVQEGFHLLSGDPVTAYLLDSLKVVSQEIYDESIFSALVAVILYVNWHREQGHVPTALVFGALLHDIGKRQLDPAILSKPRSEYTVLDRLHVETHAQRGYEFLRQLKILPQHVLDIILQHHERIDGTGFPSHLVGTQIHPHAILVGIADEFCNHVMQFPTLPALEHVKAISDGMAREFPKEMIEALVRAFQGEKSGGEAEWIDQAS